MFGVSFSSNLRKNDSLQAGAERRPRILSLFKLVPFSIFRASVYVILRRCAAKRNDFASEYSEENLSESVVRREGIYCSSVVEFLWAVYLWDFAQVHDKS